MNFVTGRICEGFKTGLKKALAMSMDRKSGWKEANSNFKFQNSLYFHEKPCYKYELHSNPSTVILALANYKASQLTSDVPTKSCGSGGLQRNSDLMQPQICQQGAISHK